MHDGDPGMETVHLVGNMAVSALHPQGLWRVVHTRFALHHGLHPVLLPCMQPVL